MIKYDDLRRLYQRVPQWVKYTILIIGLITLGVTTQEKGLIGIIILMFIYSFWRIWKARDFLMDIMRNLETRIWGKPLDKDLWEKGEMKNTKMVIAYGNKILWGRKHVGYNDKKKTKTIRKARGKTGTRDVSEMQETGKGKPPEQDKPNDGNADVL